LLAYDSGGGDVSRVFRPVEFEDLIHAMHRRYPRYTKIPIVLLVTGMRLVELQRFTEHEMRYTETPLQQWFVPDEKMIDPMGQIISYKKREKGMSLSRRIYLSPYGVRKVTEYLAYWRSNPDIQFPSTSYLDYMLERSAKDAGMSTFDRLVTVRPYVRDIDGHKVRDPNNPKKWMRTEKTETVSSYLVSQKTFRKTSSSWKIVLFPQLEGWIAASMGHSVETARRYYQERGYAKEDIQKMIKYFEGLPPPSLEDIKAEMDVK